MSPVHRKVAPSSKLFHSTLSSGKTNAPATATAPYSSDGPTLPIIGAPVGISVPRAAEPKEPTGRAKKKRKMDDGVTAVISSNEATTTSVLSRPASKSEPQPPSFGPLQEPWTLLAPSLCSSLASRMGPLAGHVTPIVYTKNQNIRSGINTLKRHLVTFPSSSTITPTTPASSNKASHLLAVSAQGEGTPKLVTIIEMTKRVVKPVGDMGEKDTVHDWYLYTSLGSRVMDNPKKDGKDKSGVDDREQEADAEAEAFESLAEIQEKELNARRSARTVPVLTVWLSRTRIPEFSDVLGEEIVQVSAAAAA